MAVTTHTAMRVDGNALAGLLGQVFTRDVTTMRASCRLCGTIGPLAEAAVEVDEVAAIVLCRGCTHTLFTVLRRGDAVTVVFGALGALEG